MMSPRHVASSRILATPYAAIPRLNIIHASLPMLDGQNTSDGRKKRRWAYERRRPSGTAIVNAR